ncbi:MAG TPA: NAD-glutamate dehydrogenase [Thermoanaerobaculia bacterium]|nr:NAD-glutamate dehydrogenase [Thermoanaerobaculia bacterium]
MTVTGTTLPDGLIERLAEELAAALPAGQAAAAAELLRRCYVNLPPEELRERPREQLVGAVRELWALGQRRLPRQVEMRVFNPADGAGGWGSDHTVVQVVNDDMPFLLASLTGELHRRERRIHQVLHPVLWVERDAAGELERLVAAGEGAAESWMHLEIDRETGGAAGLEELEATLREVLAQVRVVVEDWGAMQAKVEEVVGRWGDQPPPVEPGELDESRAFLDWLLDHHFSFLGYRRYDLVEEGDETRLRLDPGSGLGLLRRATEDAEQRSAAALPPYLVSFLRRQELLILTKSSRRSPVHRPVHMDSIGIRRFDERGEVIGEDRFLGLFTSTVYSISAQTIPVLRRKVRRIQERTAFAPRSHDAKALLHILESFPRDELFQIAEDDLFRMTLGILQLQQRQRVALFVRRDQFERFASALVYVPRERYTYELRQRMQEILEQAFGGKVTAFYTQMADAPLARTHYIVKTTPGEIPPYDLKALEEELAEAARSWQDHLREHLVGGLGEEEGLSRLQTWGRAFPVGYRERFPAKEALPDIAVMERLERQATGFDARLYRPRGASEDTVHLKLYQAGRHLALSDALPVLENLGVWVEAEVPFEITRAGAPPLWIHDFELRAADARPIPLDDTREELEETLRRVWGGEIENGILNRLVLCCGLQWHQVVVLRAYSRYLRQIGVTFSQRYMAQTLVRNAELARRLLALFDAQFDPARQDDRAARAAAILAEIQQRLEDVESLDQDRILRGFLSVIKATVRTNHFQTDAAGQRKPYLSFKLDSGAIRDLPSPRPWAEIFVYSPRVEGIHLRGGKVARGGIRWSDRREDFRTEILGLLKAQMVKNAVIVPVGAKGGFVVKQPPAGGREALLAEGVECYKTLIRGMLDLTDNLVGGEVVRPPQVVRRDGDDTYLVVAADKGTATFSDIANGVAAEYGFWLGDAFASGGSAGYDHKKMGITARGAWEAVKRHFRELGRDVQKEDFTVVGVGDMAGDVFGNGMLLSRHVKLVGAFNHQHVFLDPDPDPAASFRERQRLFALPRSTWADYDRQRLSPGGGVFERSAKAVPLAEEAQVLLGLYEEQVTPNELIRALLAAPVDLLWLGGIGTFVKGAEERHGDVGDRANDPIRVDAPQLRCKVVGEGANLGFTQRARVELALAGGKINTDAIDNSGGVDTSDHEVNIKIALNEPLRAGELDLAARNALLEEMTAQVGALVLRDNYLQTQALSLTETRGAELLDQQTRMVRALERAGRLDRRLEGLPDDEEIAQRAAQRRGLTRPELAVLLAYAKIALYEDLLASDLPDDPLLAEDLHRYFPQPLQRAFPEAIAGHRLRREIVATYITNSTVNRVGPTFVYGMMEASGRDARDVARAYTITRDAFDLRRLWEAVEALDNRVPAAVQLRMLLAASRLTEHVTLWFLRRCERPLEVSKVVAVFRPALRQLSRDLEPLLPGGARRELRRRAREYTREGVPEKLALQVAALRDLAAGVDIVRLAVDSGNDVERVARIYFALGERFGLEWLRGAAARLKAETAWQQSAVEMLQDDLYLHQSAITRQALAGEGADTPWRRAIEAWTEAHLPAVQRTLRLVEELRGAADVDLAMLTVADHQLQQLAR